MVAKQRGRKERTEEEGERRREERRREGEVERAGRRERGCELCVPSYKATNPIMRASASRNHGNLVTSQRPHF